MVESCMQWRRAILGLIGLCRATAATITCAACLSAQGASAAPTHPLDPLDADELIAIRDILAKSDRFSADTNFAWIGLDEPPKAAVAAFRPGADFPRRAALDAIDYQKGKTFRVTVDLKAARIAALADLGTQQPGLTDRDSARARLIVDADPRI